MDLAELTRQTLEKAQEAIKAAQNDPKMRKAIDLAVGLVGYNLQTPAKQLVPLLSPFQKTIPRIVKPGANSDNWRVITSLSSPKLFSTESAAGSLFTTSLSSPSAAFKVAAIQGKVTREAQAASQGFDDALAKETRNALLLALKLEGQAFLGATLTALGGAPAAPTVALGTTAGGITAGATTYYARIVAMNLFAFNRVASDMINLADTNANSENMLTPVGVLQAKLQTIALGATAVTGCGMTQIGAEGNSGSQTPTNKSLKITWAAVPGAVAYIVFVGTTTGAANLKAECIVTQTQVTLFSLAGTGAIGTDAAVPAADETDDANAYDGIIPQLIAAGSGAYLKNVNGVLVGTAAKGEVVELQDAFASIYQNAKIGKFRVIMSGLDARLLAAKGIISNSMQIFATPTAEGRMNMTIGAHVGEILNATTGDICPVDVEPWLAPGTIVILPTEIPYPDANALAPFQWVGSHDWERWDYASTASTGPIYPFDVRCNGVLEGIFTGGCGLLYNVWKG